MNKSVKKLIRHTIEIIFAMLFCAGFMICGAAIDSCDVNSVSISQALITFCIGVACIGIGGFGFSILNKDE